MKKIVNVNHKVLSLSLLDYTNFPQVPRQQNGLYQFPLDLIHQLSLSAIVVQ